MVSFRKERANTSFMAWNKANKMECLLSENKEVDPLTTVKNNVLRVAKRIKNK